MQAILSRLEIKDANNPHFFARRFILAYTINQIEDSSYKAWLNELFNENSYPDKIIYISYRIDNNIYVIIDLFKSTRREVKSTYFDWQGVTPIIYKVNSQNKWANIVNLFPELSNISSPNTNPININTNYSPAISIDQRDDHELIAQLKLANETYIEKNAYLEAQLKLANETYIEKNTYLEAQLNKANDDISEIKAQLNNYIDLRSQLNEVHEQMRELKVMLESVSTPASTPKSTSTEQTNSPIIINIDEIDIEDFNKIKSIIVNKYEESLSVLEIRVRFLEEALKRNYY